MALLLALCLHGVLVASESHIDVHIDAISQFMLSNAKADVTVVYDSEHLMQLDLRDAIYVTSEELNAHVRGWGCRSTEDSPHIVLVLVNDSVSLMNLCAINDLWKYSSRWVWNTLPQLDLTPHRNLRLFSNMFAFTDGSSVFRARIDIEGRFQWKKLDNVSLRSALSQPITLGGSHLSTALLPYSIDMYCSDSSCAQVRGSYVDLMHQLADHFDLIVHYLNFNSTISELSENALDLITAGKVDVGPWISEATDLCLSVQVVETRLCAVTQRLSVKYKSLWWSFSAPFSNQVWVATVASVLGTGMSLWIVQYLGIRTKYWTLTRCIWAVFLSLVKQGEELAGLLNNGSKCLFGMWGVAAMILSSYYTAFLFVSLATFDQPQPFDSVNHMIQLIKTNRYKLALVSQPLIMTFVNNTEFSGGMTELGELLKQSTLKYVYSNDEIIELLENRETDWVVIQDCRSAANILKEYCNGWLMEVDETPVVGRLAVKCDSCLMKILDNHLFDLIKFGLMHGWDRRHQPENICRWEEERRVQEHLAMAHMQGTIIVFLVGCALGLCILALETAGNHVWAGRHGKHSNSC